MAVRLLQFVGAIWQEGNMYTAYCPELDLATCGHTIEEAQRNLREVIEIFLKRPRRWERCTTCCTKQVSDSMKRPRNQSASWLRSPRFKCLCRLPPDAPYNPPLIGRHKCASLKHMAAFLCAREAIT